MHSSGEAACDAATRAGRIEAGLAAIEAPQTRLHSPKARLKTKVAAEQATTATLAAAGGTRWVSFHVNESTELTYRQERRGRPGDKTRYRRSERPVYTVEAKINAATVAYAAVTDGCFPAITNDRQMSPAETSPPTS